MDFVTVIATVISAVAAIAAAVSAYFTFLTNRDLKKERHVMIKPIFRVKSVNENHEFGMIFIGVKNVGYKRAKNTIQIEWVGGSGVTVTIDDMWNSSNAEDEDFRITLHYKNEMEAVRGHLNLIYSDIFSKEYVEILNVEITYDYNDFIEKKQRRLTPIDGKYFEN
ncbi:hypothetical protein [Lysinibacillus fusiformis]|uniref:hypothetical protein n=1 Tax=Lysinibacillus fusiformis TaxID=28031 RepID=UPI00263BD9C4|nr:hypothetical protein [Lysinibacillus fusiformis]MDC6268025.1 hypothetical protein [Lysinibacillus sphaericus]MDN4967485.1 hypothetical protein [Lysinibacillus fusiformis]